LLSNLAHGILEQRHVLSCHAVEIAARSSCCLKVASSTKSGSVFDLDFVGQPALYQADLQRSSPQVPGKGRAADFFFFYYYVSDVPYNDEVGPANDLGKRERK